MKGEHCVGSLAANELEELMDLIEQVANEQTGKQAHSAIDHEAHQQMATRNPVVKHNLLSMICSFIESISLRAEEQLLPVEREPVMALFRRNSKQLSSPS